MGRTYLGTRGTDLLDGYVGLSVFGAVFKVYRRRLAKPGYRHKGRAQLAVVGYFELRGARLVEVNGRKVKAAHVKLIYRFKSCEYAVLVGCSILLLTKIIYSAAYFVNPGSHHFGVKAVFLTAAVEIRAVERQGLVHLEPCNAERHHDIRDGVCLRKEIRNFTAGLDIPVGHVECAHLSFGVSGKLAAFFDLALAHRLHGLERERGLHALLY